MLGQGHRPPKAFRTAIISLRPMVDLRTEIAGVRLRNPTMLASGFLDETGGAIAPVFHAGARAGGPKSIGPKPRGGYPKPPPPQLQPPPLKAGRPPDPRVVDNTPTR